MFVETVGDSESGSGKGAGEGEKKLFPVKAPGKRPDYGTNNTLELLEKIPSQMVELKLDEVLTAVKDVDNLCDYARCKAKTSLIGETCGYCNQRFCFKHNLPEVHGCGEAAKSHQRKEFMHPKPAKTIRQEADLAQAKKRLQSKLQNMQMERSQKATNTTSSRGGSNQGSRTKKKSK